MERQPTLRGLGVTLRPLRSDDWDGLFAVAQDPQIWAQHPMRTRWQEPLFRAFFDDAMAAGGALAIIDTDTGRVAGSSQIRPHPLDPQEIEIGWTFIARSYWGRGLNATVKRLMIGHVLETRDRVVFRVGDSNFRSRKAMEKIGARLTDAVQTGEVDGRPVCHVVYEITRAMFARGPLVSL